MNEELIAPCGMNCRLCIAYQFMQKYLNKEGLFPVSCSFGFLKHNAYDSVSANIDSHLLQDKNRFEREMQ